MPIHLRLDMLLGALLVISPWSLQFADKAYLPHVIFGILEIGAGLLTSKVPSVIEKPQLGL